MISTNDPSWVRDCPQSWRFIPIKHVCALNQSVLAEDTEQNYEFRYIDISNVTSAGEWSPSEPMVFGKAPSRARRVVQSEDVIISTVRTYLKAIAFLKRIKEPIICSTGFAVLTPGEHVEPSFLAYWVQSTFIIDEIVSRSAGVSYPAINANEIGRLPFPNIDIQIQRAIAAFLDRKTAQVDALIAAYERLLTLLEEKRQAVITQAVTQGLDPTVTMKDSGVAWLGQVPAHWRVMRNKVLFEEFDHRNENEAVELLSVSHITGVTKRSEKHVNMFLAESLIGYKICLPGDLVINTMWAWMGALGISPHEGVVSPSYNVYRIRQGTALDPGYYDYLCRTPRHVTTVKAHSTGVWESRLRLYPNVFLDLRTCVPPLEEQRAIVQHIQQQLHSMDGLAEKCNEGMVLLTEYRAALVTAAVTGQIEVREEVAQDA